MRFLEKNLEQILYENLNTFALGERGLEVGFVSKLNRKRQLRIGNYGKADLVTVERKDDHTGLLFTVYELKINEIDMNSLIQATRYVNGIKSYLEKYKPGLMKLNNDFKIILIGSEVNTDHDWIYLFDVFDIDVEVYLYFYQIDGLQFQPIYLQNYNLADKGF
jgi:hypothetical protein